MKFGDLVKFIHKGQVDLLLGIIVSDRKDNENINHPDVQDVWWMSKDRVSPIKTDYLEVL
jgi:hypothetical protein